MVNDIPSHISLSDVRSAHYIYGCLSRGEWILTVGNPSSGQKTHDKASPFKNCVTNLQLERIYMHSEEIYERGFTPLKTWQWKILACWAPLEVSEGLRVDVFHFFHTLWRIEFVHYGLSAVLMRKFEPPFKVVALTKPERQLWIPATQGEEAILWYEWIHTRNRMCRVLLLTEAPPISSKWKKNNFRGWEDNRNNEYKRTPMTFLTIK